MDEYAHDSSPSVGSPVSVRGQQAGNPNPTEGEPTSNELAIPIGEAVRRLGISHTTIRRWENEGHITSTRTPGNQRLYKISDVEMLAAGKSPGNGNHSPVTPNTNAGTT
ncbi:MerR family DNA-binding transcriptional regulator [Brevibacterium aurantiacum]|uniref:MerR family DNA-binding transcriptional regulator n=1 Tax=Brevibacterium aurantiacum TaxID=273384 RepID=UPI003F917061